MDITFKSERPRDEVAQQMAHFLAEWFQHDWNQHHSEHQEDSVTELFTFWDEDAQKHEITYTNDYQLYVEQDGQFGYLDRYHPPERIAFLVEKLEGWEGASDVQQRQVVKEF